MATIVGCSAGHGSSPISIQPSPVPSSATTPTPLLTDQLAANTSADPESEPITTPSARPTETSLATSAPRTERQANLFWNAVTPSGIYRRDYTTLRSIAKSVDLIVVGRIVDVYTGSIQTTDSNWDSVWAHLSIEDVLKGKPQSRTVGVIEIALTTSSTWAYARENVPDEQLVLFLMNEAKYRERYGQDPINPEVERFMYWRPNEQAVLRNVNGQVAVIDSERLENDYGLDVFPMTVFGDSFAPTIDAIRKAAATE